jgi:hypothetical protein
MMQGRSRRIRSSVGGVLIGVVRRFSVVLVVGTPRVQSVSHCSRSLSANSITLCSERETLLGIVWLLQSASSDKKVPIRRREVALGFLRPDSQLLKLLSSTPSTLANFL